jgi:uncharacterized alpha-E superfamily protein
MKQSVSNSVATAEKLRTEMSDHIWETFDGLFKTVHRQGRRVEELEARITELERRLAERAGTVGSAQQQQPKQAQPTLSEMPVERAA